MLERISKFHNSLSNAERRVAEWVINNPHQLVTEPLSQIARLVRVSEPTVVRFCRSMGCTGFSDFKMRLAQDLAITGSPVHQQVKVDDSVPEIIAKVVGAGIDSLNQVRLNVQPDQIEATAGKIANAQHVSFIGIGASGIVAEDAQNKFFRLGIPCIAYSDSPTILQSAALANSKHVIIAISKTGKSEVVVEACTRAVETGAKVIAITSPRSPLSVAAHIELLIDIDEDTDIYTPMSSRLSQLAVLDVVQVVLALRLGERGVESLRLTKAALSLP